MKHTITILAILAAFGAHAGGKPPARSTSGPTANQNTHVGITNVNAALSAARSSSRSASMATGGSASALGGSAYGGLGGAGGTLDMAGARIGSDVNVQPSAPSVYGVASPPSPTTCDGAGVSIGGSGRSGGGLLNFGVGERESCLAAQDTATMRAAGFTAEDVQRRVCMVSTIAKTPTCKKYAEKDASAERAAALLEDRHGRAYLAARDPGLLP